MNVPFIKIEKKTNGKIEQAKVIISIFCELNNKRLSDTITTIASYFMVYGLNETTKNLIIKSKLATKHSIKNVMTELRKADIIKKIDDKEGLNKNLDVEVGQVIVMAIKIDNK